MRSKVNESGRSHRELQLQRIPGGKMGFESTGSPRGPTPGTALERSAVVAVLCVLARVGQNSAKPPSSQMAPAGDNRVPISLAIEPAVPGSGAGDMVRMTLLGRALRAAFDESGGLT
jgi:hypothetical protein